MLIVITVLITLGMGAHQLAGPFVAGHQAQISVLPGYALRTTMRMLAVLLAALGFTLACTTGSGKSSRAEGS